MACLITVVASASQDLQSLVIVGVVGLGGRLVVADAQPWADETSVAHLAAFRPPRPFVVEQGSRTSPAALISASNSRRLTEVNSCQNLICHKKKLPL